MFKVKRPKFAFTKLEGQADFLVYKAETIAASILVSLSASVNTEQTVNTLRHL